MPNIYRANYTNQENRGKPPEKKDKKKKHFKDLKCNTIKSLNDVEYFLNNINHYVKCFKIYKICRKK